MLRNRKRTLQAVKKLDAFPKISEECVETTSTGGTFSLLGFGVIIWLVIWECIYYMDTEIKYKFTPDTNFPEKLRMNIDITVHMPCKFVGADVLDVTGQQVLSFGELEMEDTWYELDPNQQIHFESMQRVNRYLREQFHSIHQFMWTIEYTSLFNDLPQRIGEPMYPKDACRIHGSMEINKVAGNFHITAGKTLQLPRGHAHLAIFMDDQDYNFTHRIEKFSFGNSIPGIIQPLEGDEQVSENGFMNYQYFITVVPTLINTYAHKGSACQYSVSHLSREISHNHGSHGTPGIFFKYDTSALKVEVKEQHESFLKFITRLSGIIGGVFTVSGLLSRIIEIVMNCAVFKFLRQVFMGPNENVVASVEVFSASILTSVPTTTIANSPMINLKPIMSTPELSTPTLPIPDLSTPLLSTPDSSTSSIGRGS